MKSLLLAGAGKIGGLVASLFLHTNDYRLTVVDKVVDSPILQDLQKRFKQLEVVPMDVSDTASLLRIVHQYRAQAIVSSLPFYVNVAVAEVAKEANIHYFDVTEDVAVTQAVKVLAKDSQQAFVPQCGLAPGFISIAANDLMQRFDDIDTVRLRVGALPRYASNSLHYALTWSTEGLVNQYGNSCTAIIDGKKVTVRPLESVETIKITGETYEAFNTSGGLGSLADSYQDKVKHLGYKTLRYPGHCEKMRVLMYDLKLNEDRKTLIQILDRAVPKTTQDIVIIYVSVNGMQEGSFVEESYVKKILPQWIDGRCWSAIQLTTASAFCALVDMVFAAPERYQGLVLQEDFALSDFLANRFGEYYREV